jgi:protoporphyrinogen oxidase
MKKPQKSVLILGAGVAGLACAYELAQKGFKVTVFEKYNFIGGLAATLQVGEFRFDTGPHRWYAKNDEVNDWMLRLLDDEIIKVKRLTRIYFDKKYFYYPIRITNALLGIGPLSALQAAVDYVVMAIKRRIIEPNLINLEDGYINQFGKTLYKIFFKRYTEKLWGISTKDVSIDWLGQRTRGLNISTIIKDAVFKTRNVVSLIDEFYYPKLGVGRIAEKMAEEIEEMGGEIILSAEVVSFKAVGNTVKEIKVKIGNKVKSIIADEIVNTIPITHVIERLSPTPPLRIRSASEKLKYRAELQVTLFINKEKISPDVWIYVHPKEISFMRLMEMDNWSPDLQPKGKTAIVFEIACTEGDSMWKKTDDEIIDLVKTDYINEFKTVTKEEILGGYVHRVPHEYPIYHVGYEKPLEEIKIYLAVFKNFQTIGRNGMFRYNNMDHSIEMGMFAARNIIAGKRVWNVDNVNIEREYLEEKKLD